MPESTTNCTYKLINNLIHQITLNTSTRQTVEDLFAMIGQILEEISYQQQYNIYLLDASSCGDLPYRYLAQRAQQWYKAYPDAPPSRTAILYPMGMLASMFNILLQQLSNKAETKLFTPDKRNEAIEWLLK